MNLKIISTYKGFLELKNDWKDIFEKSGTKNIFVSWEWCSLWVKHCRENQELLVLIVKDGEEVIGIAPLMVSNGSFLIFGRSVVSFLGGDIADYMDFLILRNNKEVIRIIINFLIKLTNWGIIDFKRIPESSPNLTPIKECIAELRYPYGARISCINHIVRIKGGWDDYYRSVSKGLKQDIRTAHNKFKLLGEISFETYNENTLDELLDVLFALHKKRHIYKIGQSLFEREANRDFFYDLALAFTRLGWADISALKINNRIISAVFAFKYNGVFYYWVPAFDPEVIKYSPGKVHIHTLLKNCFEQNFKEFDFMRGDEEYKFKWANNTLNNYELKVYRGKFYRRLDALKTALRNYLKDLYDKYPLFKKMLIRISKSKLLLSRQ